MSEINSNQITVGSITFEMNVDHCNIHRISDGKNTIDIGGYEWDRIRATLARRRLNELVAIVDDEDLAEAVRIMERIVK